MSKARSRSAEELPDKGGATHFSAAGRVRLSLPVKYCAERIPQLHVAAHTAAKLGRLNTTHVL